jgi:hypothetical protein
MKTESQLLVEAIRNLKPTSEFVITEADYSTIQWHILDGDAPTQEEIYIAIEQVKTNELQTIANAEAAKAAAEAKLAALGLTADDLKALGLGSN